MLNQRKHCFFNSWPDQCNRITGARRLYGISCSAALFCEFCATRRIRFFVSDLFQKRPSWRGAAVAGPFCQKKEEAKDELRNTKYQPCAPLFLAIEREQNNIEGNTKERHAITNVHLFIFVLLFIYILLILSQQRS